MSPEGALRQVISYQQYFFQYKENGQLFQYMQGKYPITGMLFGLFFEDGQLTSLLLDQAVTDFGNCRFNFYKQQETWPLNGFQTIASWIRQQDRLGDEYNDASIAYLQNANNSDVVSAEEVVEIASYLPMVVVALPFYGLYKIAGGSDEEQLQSESPEELRKRASQIDMEVTTDIELIRLLGAPNSKRGKEQPVIWTYTSPEILFGIVDGTVRWSESLYWGVPLNSVTVRRNIRCVPSS
jgi:hypothetical protein